MFLVLNHSYTSFRKKTTVFFKKMAFLFKDKKYLTRACKSAKIRKTGKGLKMNSQLAKRIISSFVLAPMVVAIVWFGKPIYENFSIPAYSILLAVLGTGLCWEWEHMISRNITINALLMTLSVCLCAFLTPDNPSFALWVVGLSTAFIFWKSRFNIALAFGVPYICLPVVSLSYLYFIEGSISRDIVLWLFFVVWATDIGAYLVGTTVRGPKICPRISPNKTWSGLIGGVGFAMLVAFLFALWMGNDPQEGSVNIPWRILLTISAGILAVVSQVGDFFESFIKRQLDLKDSSNLIPGHGGLFDRVDGLLFAAMGLALFVLCFTQGWFS